MALTIIILGIIVGCFIAVRLPAIYADWRYRREAKRIGIILGTPDDFDHEWID